MLYQVTIQRSKNRKNFKFTAPNEEDAIEWAKRQADEWGDKWSANIKMLKVVE